MIVFDASTLILIAKAEMLDSFLSKTGLSNAGSSGAEFYIAIPPAVEKECCDVKKSLDALAIRQALSQSRIRVTPVQDRKFVVKVQSDFGLGIGEAEAIVLALEAKARALGIDDKNGINACKLLGIAFTTAINILVRMREKRLFTAREALAKLGALAIHGRYKKSILEEARRELETAI